MRKSEIGRNILNALLISGAIILAFQHPARARKFWRQLPKEWRKYKESQLKRAIDYLKRQNKVEYIKEKNGVIIIKITKAGKDYLNRVNFDNLVLKQPKIWDRKWHLVIFDIPEKKKPAREALREKLKDLGLRKLQHSIWVTPFPCEKEINLIKTIFHLSDYWIDVILTGNLGAREYQMRKYFDLV